MSDYDPARAQALLDLYGYVDRDGDGWRDQPDGTPLVLEYATAARRSISRQLDELWQKNMDAIGIRIVFKTAQWPENLKAARAGKLMMWGVAWSAAAPDGERRSCASATARTRARPTTRASTSPAFNALYEQLQRRCPTAPSARRADRRGRSELLVAYMPYKAHVHRISPTDAAVGGRLPRATCSCASSGTTSTSTTSSARRDAHDARAPNRLTARAIAGCRRLAAGGSCRPRWPPSPAAPPSAEGPALCLPSRRDRLRSGADQRPVLAHRHRRTSSRACYSYDHLARPGADRAADRGGMPEVSDDFRTWTFRIKPGIFFADDPAFKGKPRELVAAGLRLFAQALRRPGATRARRGQASRTEGIVGLRRAARRRRSTAQAPFDYDSADRRPARARPLHARSSSCAEPRPRFLEHPGRAATSTARSRARSSSSTATSIMAHPVGTGPVPARRMAAQLAHRARAQPRASATAATTPSRPPTMPRARRCWRASRAGACRWSTGVEIVDHRGGAAALAVLPQRRGRLRRARAGRVRARTRCPNGKLAPNLAKRASAATASSRPTSTFTVSTWTTRGRRLHRRAGRAAPRDRAG